MRPSERFVYIGRPGGRNLLEVEYVFTAKCPSIFLHFEAGRVARPFAFFAKAGGCSLVPRDLDE